MQESDVDAKKGDIIAAAHPFLAKFVALIAHKFSKPTNFT